MKKIKKIYHWLLEHFMVGFILLILFQGLILGFGIKGVLYNYTRSQSNMLNNAALEIIKNPKNYNIDKLEWSNSFFVFDINQSVIFSNRGRGKSIPVTELTEVRSNKEIIGYYYAGEIEFQNNQANKTFLTSIILLITSSLVGSLIIGLLVSFKAAKKISGPINQINQDVQEMKNLQPIIVRDFNISELRNISEKINSTSIILTNQENYKKQWMQDMAHDLRTPIASLKSQIEGMIDGVLDLSVERLEKNIVEVRRLETLVGDIATLHMAESLTDLKMEEFSLTTLVNQILHSNELKVSEKKLNIKHFLKKDLVIGQRDLLHRAIGNIINNAILYCREKDNIEIKSDIINNRIHIQIKDSGPGVPVQNLDKLFNRFYRGEYARKTDGTGLGLNISKEIIERHSGELTASLNKTGGLTFEIIL